MKHAPYLFIASITTSPCQFQRSLLFHRSIMKPMKKRLKFSLPVPVREAFAFCTVRSPAYEAEPRPWRDFMPPLPPHTDKLVFVKRLDMVREDLARGMSIQILYIGSLPECERFKADLHSQKKRRSRRNSI